MSELLRAMIKEEWRIHSSMYGSRLFACFPLIIAGCSFVASLLIPAFSEIMPYSTLALIAHLCFVMMGSGSGAFGLMGREVMNRRFGQASLLAYSSRTLPVSDREILSTFIVKDVLYYEGLWILPFVVGFALATPFASIPFAYAPLLLVTLSLSYMLGLALVFALSTVYVYSKRLLALLMVAAGAIFVAAAMIAKTSLLEMLPTYLLFMTGSWVYLLATLGIIIILCVPPILFARVDFPSEVNRFGNLYSGLERRLSFTRYSQIMAKDALDLERSTGGVGKLIFSLLLPLAFVWMIISIYLRYLEMGNFTIIFAIFSAIASSSIYNWFTEYDLFSAYAFFPVRVSTVIKSKVMAFCVFDTIPAVLIAIVALVKGQLAFLPAAIIAFASLSLFTLSITVYLAGLRPNVLLYNAKLFALYVAAVIFALCLLLSLSFLGQYYLLLSAILIPASGFILMRSYERWDRVEQASF